tara:strand:+ start:86 stop:550 length:465 start_codon:yes stop_codon:yes gene_type:complete
MKQHNSFALYRPNELVDFLNFLKENPDDSFVYVLVQPNSEVKIRYNSVTGEEKRINPPNILPAREFGHFVFCLEQGTQVMYSPGPFVHKMKKNLKDIRAKDYVLCMGDPAIIAASCAIISDVTQGQFSLLKWDRMDKRYFPIQYDLYQKGQTDE